MKKDIAGKREIHLLVDAFYEKVKKTILSVLFLLT